MRQGAKHKIELGENMTTEEKSKAVLLAIRDMCNKAYKEQTRDKPADPVTIGFGPDWRDNSLTVTSPDGHTHVGWVDLTDDQLIDSMYNLFCNKSGLSWA